MVRQWQDLFYDERHSHTKMVNPDFVKLAEAMHVKGLRASTDAELEQIMYRENYMYLRGSCLSLYMHFYVQCKEHRLGNTGNHGWLVCVTHDQFDFHRPEFINYTDGPVVLDARVLSTEHVYPMVAAGCALDNMTHHPKLRTVDGK